MSKGFGRGDGGGGGGVGDTRIKGAFYRVRYVRKFWGREINR